MPAIAPSAINITGTSNMRGLYVAGFARIWIARSCPHAEAIDAAMTTMRAIESPGDRAAVTIPTAVITSPTLMNTRERSISSIRIVSIGDGVRAADAAAFAAFGSSGATTGGAEATSVGTLTGGSSRSVADSASDFGRRLTV